MTPHIQLDSLSKAFGKVKVIKDINLEIHQGEFIVFVGPSGCGKSTLLRMIAGLETISQGQLLIDGRIMNDAAPVDRGIAMVFQSYALYPNMNVRQNLAFGLEQAKMPKAKIAEKVEYAAKTLKIDPLLDRRPAELSGGQSQRVAIGRAIVRDPNIFLFDEPLSNLDAELRVHMRVELKALHARLRRTMIYVTHDQTEAMTMADRIVVFQGGKIEQVGSPLELYNNPVNKFVAGFIGSPQMNFIAVEKSNDNEVQISGGAAVGVNLAHTGKMILGLRPEQTKICEPGEGLATGHVLTVEQLGGESFIYLDLGSLSSLPFVVKVAGQTQAQPGDTIGIKADASDIYLFDAETEKCVWSSSQPRLVG